MIQLSDTLSYYKRKDIQDAIVIHAKSKEIAVKFGDKGFGKRPDTLQYSNDILELAKQGATSFHASEEIWKNPLRLDTSMKKQEIDELRKGWDLVLDIDCPHWGLSKLITWLIIQTLKEEGIVSISVKFSGNKGFHIGVPYEVFPRVFEGKGTELLFPEYARRIAEYILDRISKRHIKITSDNSIEFSNKYKLSVDELMKAAPKPDELFVKRCKECNKIVKKQGEESTEFICPKCENRVLTKKDETYQNCPKCNYLMERMGKHKIKCECGSDSFEIKFNPFSIIEVDTILISSRHLYRMPYSLHEKSGLASIPLDPDKVLEFEKDQANPEKVKVSKFVFLDREKISPDEAKKLLTETKDWRAEEEQISKTEEGKREFKGFEALEEAIPEEFFPPCIKNILNGLEDGKKRSLFVLTNFLTSVGWDYEGMETILNEWNSKNKEQIREVLIKGQLRYHKTQKKQILPPNCQNVMYYKDLQICTPDNLCSRIKNPVQYSKRKTYYLNQEKKKDKKEGKDSKSKDSGKKSKDTSKIKAESSKVKKSPPEA